MPTTCGFPSCKFRSRYRGQEDNRHFYRIPKRPQVLRQRWLSAIGRTEETVVSQLRICSAHFEGGEKKEGDIPVPDPTVDKQLNIELPPKEGKNSDRRRKQTLPARFSSQEPSGSSALVKKSRPFTNFFNSSPFDQSATLLQNISPEGQLNDILNSNKMNGPSSSRPLVALLDGRDCSVEMPLLKDVATVAFCDAQSTIEIHEKVLNEAVAALMYSSIKLDKSDLEKFKALRVVVKIGSGIENIDVKAASELGIAVCQTPGEYIEEVADFTFSLILNLYRKMMGLVKLTSESRKAISAEQMREAASGSRRIKGDTLGIIGLGLVGSAVALRAKPFGMKVICYDPYLKPGFESVISVERCATLAEFLSKADCISIHCPLTAETTQIIKEDTLKHCKPGVFLVNTSNQALVNHIDLAAALKTGHVRGAALDHQTNLPFPEGPLLNPYAGCQNFIQTPNAAWYCEAHFKELRAVAAKEIRKAITGRCPSDLAYCINKDSLGNASMARKNHGMPNPAAFLQNMQNFGFPGLQMSQMNPFTYANPLMAMSSMGINPFMNNLAQFNPAAALSNLAAQAQAQAQAAANRGKSPAQRISPNKSTPSPNRPSTSNGNSDSPASKKMKIDDLLDKLKSEEVESNGTAETPTEDLVDVKEEENENEASEAAEGASTSGQEDEVTESIDAESLKEQLGIGELDEPEEIAVGLNGSRANFEPIS